MASVKGSCWLKLRVLNVDYEVNFDEVEIDLE
jgi:hypothetical protein